jgi:hypothetical protein
MTNRKPLLLVIFLCLLSGLTLSACGSSSPDNSVPDRPQVSVEPQEAALTGPKTPLKNIQLSAPASIEDLRMLVVGGGFYALHSEAVLERNVLWTQELWSKNQNHSLSLVTLFASGPKSGKLDVLEKVVELEEREEIFASLFYLSDHADSSTRSHQIENVDDAATKKALTKQLEDVIAKSPLDQGFRFYFTGHGSQGRNEVGEDDFTKNRLHLWNDEEISVQEFTSLLDRLDPSKPTQVMMVQCFSGGFADINYVGADRSKGLSPHHRCGFFSQIRTLPAAGCTPDLLKREEYSPYFLAATAGKTEAGVEVDADYNKDGKVGADEAHAYVILHEKAADVPISTSSELLRQELPRLTLKDWQSIRTEADLNLTAVEAAILRGLMVLPPYTNQLNILKRMNADYDQLEMAAVVAQVNLEKIRNKIRRELLSDFPFLYGAVNFYKLQQDTEKQFSYSLAMETLEARPDYEDLKSAFQNAKAAVEKMHDLGVQRARVMRRVYLLETKLYEKKLRQLGKKNVLFRKYEQLKTCEAEPFF